MSYILYGAIDEGPCNCGVISLEKMKFSLIKEILPKLTWIKPRGQEIRLTTCIPIAMTTASETNMMSACKREEKKQKCVRNVMRNDTHNVRATVNLFRLLLEVHYSIHQL